MKHEYLNGDAMEEIVVDESIELFILHPPYFGVDVNRYARPEKQLNKVKNKKAFIKNLVKVTHNAAKALKHNGSILMVLPSSDYDLMHRYLSTVAKKSNLQHNVTMVWSYYDQETADGIYPSYAYVIHLSKGLPRHDKEYINKHLNPILEFKNDHEQLRELYATLAYTSDAMSLELTKHLIKMFTLEGDTVSELFGGTGTVVLAAESTGRNSVYNDISEIQLKLARKRFADFKKTEKD
jgi:hypothetical protein